MKTILLVIGCFALTAADSSIKEQWNSFKAEHKKKYLNDSEESLRLSIFAENLKEIEEHNAKYKNGEVTYFLKMNHFGDLSPEEFSAKFSGYKRNSLSAKSSLVHNFTYKLNANIPDSIDWRNKGAVTPVKNQANCNGCWSFSATGAMEGQLFQSTGNLVSLSEQQLIDCSKSFGNGGCNGGRMEYAFMYLKEAGGIESEDNYPFLGSDGMCTFSSKSIVNGSKVISFVELPAGDEKELKAAVATVGPVSVAVAADLKFMLYAGGILTSEGCGTELNHAVLVVGYGSESNEDYWIVKNSWTTKWGEEGYVRIARNQGNVCGLATFGSYPVLEKTTKDKPIVEPSQSPSAQPSKPHASNAWKTVISSGHLLFTCLFFIYFSINI